MRRLVPAFVLATALSYVPAAHATPDPVGLLCGYITTAYPPARLREAGAVQAGPLVVDDATGSITCTIQVGAPTHDGPDAAVVTGPVTNGVLLAAGTVDYVLPPDTSVFVCTRLDLAGGPALYWDVGDPVNDGSWSTDPAVPCQEEYSSQTPKQPCDTVCATCLPLAAVLPDDGDVPGAWDCPPYHS
jgi:hypothetical protein